MMRRTAVGAASVATIFAGITGCSDGAGPRPLDNSVGVIASGLVRAPLGAARLGPATTSTASAGVVYVSLPPGSVPAGLRATIRNQATGQATTTAVVDGGFDPVPIAASVGDTLAVEIRSTLSATLVKVELAVAAIRPLKVVRTSPPSGGRDVPLNAIMVIVFSEPIDAATLTTGSVQLFRDTAALAGTVRFADSPQLRAEFHPSALLAPQTDYHFVVTQAVRDVNGVALAVPLDVPFTTGPIGPASGFVFASVSAGGAHTCGVTAAGAAYCWGANGNGQLGDGTMTQRTSPVPVAGGLSFRAVSAGSSHTCGVTTGGVAYCWGLNASGQLGDGTITQRTSPVPVTGGLSFDAVSAGGSYTCGVTPYSADSGISFTYCWGLNASGQLGDGTSIDRTKPHAAVPGATGTALSTGLNHTCLLNLDIGGDFCWGSNTNGQLGDGTTIDATTPVAIGWPGPALNAVSAGGSHTCAEAGSYVPGSYYVSFAAYCWGANDNGQLGDGTTTQRTSPVLVGGGLSFSVDGVSGGGQHTCGVAAAGAGIPFNAVSPEAAYCWGLNDNGQLGDGTTTQRTSPVLVAGALSFIAVSAGASHTCGVTVDAAYCWGLNSSGQLGTGTTTSSSVPVKVAGHP